MNEQYRNVMDASICKVINKYLSHERIEQNYQESCEKILPKGCIYNERLMEKVVHECRKMALSQIPKDALSLVQKKYVKKVWRIDVCLFENLVSE